MSVTSIDKDFDALTLTLTADFAASVEQVWRLFDDPRRLERWWGPPGYPATFGDHDLTPGGTVRYFMTSPEGERYHGYWTVLAVEPPRRLEVSDGFADEGGAPNAELPVTTMAVTLAGTDDGTRLQIVSSFESREQMDQLLQMQADEGMKAAVGQMDELLVAAHR